MPAAFTTSPPITKSPPFHPLITTIIMNNERHCHLNPRPSWPFITAFIMASQQSRTGNSASYPTRTTLEQLLTSASLTFVCLVTRSSSWRCFRNRGPHKADCNDSGNGQDASGCKRRDADTIRGTVTAPRSGPGGNQWKSYWPDLLPSFQVPKDHMEEFMDVKKFNVFNTNNLWISMPAIQRVVREKALDMEIIVNPVANSWDDQHQFSKLRSPCQLKTPMPTSWSQP